MIIFGGGVVCSDLLETVLCKIFYYLIFKVGIVSLNASASAKINFVESSVVSL